jgi:diguanylate cyclase (GGDEF)-like protein
MFHAAIERGASGEDVPETLLLLDLDRFKTINDAFGHRVGDRLLQMVAARLRGCVRAGDMVCRLGGDEFAITQTKAWNPERTIALADRILSEISLPYETDGYVMHIGVSIGIAFRADTSGDGEALVRAADTALYDAKDRAGNNWRIFYPGMQHRLKDRRDLEADLREAIAREELILMYQPLVRLADRRITGAEALLRWRHASRGLLAPADFISIAEETGLIVPIGNWVLNSACREAKSWAQEIPVAVNLSPVQFGSRDLIGKLNDVLAATRLPPRLLAVEMTESVLLQDNAQTRESLAALKSIGVAISMDDFGTGYSSLSYLRKFTIDKIKIDKAFTQAVDSEAESGVIVQAIVAIGQGLGIEICAEGAETEAQLDALARLGVTEVQGFALHPPMSAQDFAALLRRQG